MKIDEYLSRPDSLSQAEICRRCGLTPPNFSHYRARRRRPTGEVAIFMAQVLLDAGLLEDEAAKYQFAFAFQNQPLAA